MATITVNPEEVTVHLSALEKLGGLSGDVHIPRSTISSATYSENVFAEKRGLRMGGTSIPRRIRIGHFVVRGGTDFLVIHGPRTGVVFTLSGHRYQRVVVSLPEADARHVVTQL